MSLQLSVLQLNNYIKRIIDSEELLIGIGLYGEVSNFKIAAGNAFFDLKEDGASISCMMFGSDVVSLQNGSQVMLYGRLSYYAKTGKMSFVARRVEEIGKGELYLKYLELKEKLEKEGVFDVAHKKQIPLFSKRIGVITSETGAVLHDIISIARSKNPRTEFVLYPAKVQGEGAEFTIVEAIEYFSKTRSVDVVIVARGGGSFEDLAPFNTEVVARAIFACSVPVISAVGHETDVSISDFAADLRCPTPTAASETAVFDYYSILKKIDDCAVVSTNSVASALKNEFEKLQNVFDSCEKLVDNKLDGCLKDLEKFTLKFDSLMQIQLAEQTARYELLNLSIQKDNPLSLLSKGYVVAQVNGKVIKSVSDAKKDDIIKIKLIDGAIVTKVIGKEN